MDWVTNDTIIIALIGLFGIIWSSMMKRETLSTRLVQNATLTTQASVELIQELQTEIKRLNQIVTNLELEIKKLKGGDVPAE